MADEYTNSMRSERMGNGRDIKADITTVSPQSKSSEEVSSNEAKPTPAPMFEDAGDFIRGGGEFFRRRFAELTHGKHRDIIFVINRHGFERDLRACDRERERRAVAFECEFHARTRRTFDSLHDFNQ